MRQVSTCYDFDIIEIQDHLDHVHVLVRSVPKISPLQIVRILKQTSTVHMWKQHRYYLLSKYWREHTLWSDGYFVSSIGYASTDTVAGYIRNQG